MVTRKKTQPDFPPVCCGVCHFSETSEEEHFLCWANPPMEMGETWYRGVPVDPTWPACKDFRGRQHA